MRWRRRRRAATGGGEMVALGAGVPMIEDGVGAAGVQLVAVG